MIFKQRPLTISQEHELISQVFTILDEEKKEGEYVNVFFPIKEHSEEEVTETMKDSLRILDFAIEETNEGRGYGTVEIKHVFKNLLMGVNIKELTDTLNEFVKEWT